MNDTISRKQAIETLIAEANAEGAYGYLDAKSIEDCLANMPFTEPERKTGKWIHNRDEDGWHMWLECSECGTREVNTNAKFCPNCGSYNGGA